MATTADYALRYPDSADDLNVGAINIQQLAEDVAAALKEEVRPRYFHGVGTAAGVVAASGWVRVPLAAVVASSDFSLSGDGLTLTYVGTGGRWHSLGFGAQAVGSDSNHGVRLITNGGVAKQVNHSGFSVFMGVPWIAQLNTGDTIGIDVSTPGTSTTFTAHLNLLGGAA